MSFGGKIKIPEDVDQVSSISSFNDVPLPPTHGEDGDEIVSEDDIELLSPDNEDPSESIVDDIRQQMASDNYLVMNHGNSGGISPSSNGPTNISLVLTGNMNTYRRSSSKDSGKARQPQLLHKRLQDVTISQSEANDLIMSTNLEEMAVSSNIPQWLMYSWTSKARDKKIVEKRTQEAIAELVILKQYVLPCALCLSISVSQQEVVARNLLTLFQNIHLVLEKGASDSWSRDVRIPAPAVSKGSVKAVPGEIKVPPMPKRRDHVICFLEAMIAEEVDEAKTQSTLFRSNNIISKLLTLYANQVGKDYLNTMLSEVIGRIIGLGTMEVDPAKLDQLPAGDPGKDLNANMNKLLTASKMIVNAVVNSIPRCPLGLKKLASIIQRQVETKFGGSKVSVFSHDPASTSTSVLPEAGSPIHPNQQNHHVAVSGFIFLRFICPAIVAPDTYGFISHALTPAARRNLILVSKILQNLANGVKFGAKEVFMEPINSFLEENEPLVRGYCEALQNIDTDQVYLIPDEGLSEAQDKVRTAELNSAFGQVMAAFNTNLAKVMDKIDNVLVNEVMTYTVFGALKSIIKRFELIERVYDIALGADPNKSILVMNTTDSEILHNFVLLGGLEEILLMNGSVLLRALISPLNFIGGKSLLHLTGNSAPQASGTFRDLDILARSVVHILAPHGAVKIAEVVEWALVQEIKCRAAADYGGKKLSAEDCTRRILDPYANDDLKLSAHFNNSISFRLVVSFLLVHIRDFLKPSLSEILQEIWDSNLKYEIDPAKLTAEDNLKINLDNLVNASMKVFNGILNASKNPPASMRRVLRCIFFHLTSSSNGAAKDYDRAMTSLSYFLFVNVICPAIASPGFYGLMNDSNRGSFSSSLNTPDTHPVRTFVLISYFLRFLSQRSSSAHSESTEQFSEETTQYEKEIVIPLLDQWTKGSITLMQNLLSSPGQGLTGTLVTSGTTQQPKSQDPPLPVSSTARAKALVFIRKVLNPTAVKHLKSLIDTHEFREATKYLNAKEIAKKAMLEGDQGRREELHGLRMETIQYRIMDRVRIVFSSIYKEPESVSLMKDIKAKYASKPAVSATVTNVASYTSVSPPANTQNFTEEAERSRAGGFVVLNNKARKKMGNTGTSQSFEAAKLAHKKDESETVPAKDGKSKWSIMTNPSLMAQATKNVVKSIFANAKIIPDDADENFEESIYTPDDTEEQKDRKSQQAKQSEEKEDDADRSLLSAMRARKIRGAAAISPGFAVEKKRPKLKVLESENTVHEIKKNEGDDSDVEEDAGILNYELEEELGKNVTIAVKSKKLKRKKQKDEQGQPATSAQGSRKSSMAI